MRYLTDEDVYTIFTAVYHHRSDIQHKALIDAINSVPTADAVKRRKGKWIGGEIGYCSCCGHKGCASDIWDFCKDGEYCPNCGAEMEADDGKVH